MENLEFLQDNTLHYTILVEMLLTEVGQQQQYIHTHTQKMLTMFSYVCKRSFLLIFVTIYRCIKYKQYIESIPSLFISSEASDTDSEGEPYLAMNHKVGRGSSLSSLDTTPSRPEGASVSSLDMTPRSDIHSSPSHSSPSR